MRKDILEILSTKALLGNTGIFTSEAQEKLDIYKTVPREGQFMQRQSRILITHSDIASRSWMRQIRTSNIRMFTIRN